MPVKPNRRENDEIVRRVPLPPPPINKGVNRPELIAIEDEIDALSSGGSSVPGSDGLDGQDAPFIPGINGLNGRDAVTIPGRDGDDGLDAPFVPGKDGRDAREMVIPPIDGLDGADAAPSGTPGVARNEAMALMMLMW